VDAAVIAFPPHREGRARLRVSARACVRSSIEDEGDLIGPGTGVGATPRGLAFDEIGKDVPENSSAIVLVADPGDVDAMISAFAGRTTWRARGSPFASGVATKVTPAPPREPRTTKPRHAGPSLDAPKRTRTSTRLSRSRP
jgi:hypothetical protein